MVPMLTIKEELAKLLILDLNHNRFHHRGPKFFNYINYVPTIITETNNSFRLFLSLNRGLMYIDVMQLWSKRNF